MKDNEMTMKALSMEDLEMISGGIDDATKDLLDIIGDTVDWFDNL